MGATGMWSRKADTASTGDPHGAGGGGRSRPPHPRARPLSVYHWPPHRPRPGHGRSRAFRASTLNFMREADGVYVIDQGSRHGTFVNGERINRRKLNRNDHVEFGVQGGPHVLFSPDRSPTSAAQQFLSQFSTWKPASRRRLRPGDAERLPRGGAQAEHQRRARRRAERTAGSGACA